MPVGNVTNAFVQVIDWLTNHADARYKAITGEGDGDWATFVGLSPVDIPGAASAFSRNEINALYLQSLRDQSGTLGDCASLTLQGDYVACSQRAYVLRNATKIRRAVWTMARQQGHADTGIGIFGRVRGQAASLLTAGGSGFQAPAPAGRDLGPIAKAENLAMGRRNLR